MIISTKETHLKGKTENRGLTPRLYRKIGNLGKMRKLDFQDRTEKGKHQPNFYELSRKLIFKMRE